MGKKLKKQKEVVTFVNKKVKRAAQLKRFMRIHKITPQQLADILDISRSSVYSYMAARNFLSDERWRLVKKI